MRPLSAAAAVLFFLCVGALKSAEPQASANSSNQSAASTAARRALLDRYCVTCHNDRLRTAALTLEKIDLEDIGRSAEVWEKVLNKLSTGAMPPPRMPHPEKSASLAFASWLETGLDHAASAKPNPGRVGVHRLNRAEYANAIRDLLGLEVDGRALLPADDADQQGFDNIAGVLSVSPALLERYLSAARTVSRLAVGDPTLVPVFETYNVPKTLVQDAWMNEDLPFGTRGGGAVRHYFPLDAEYVVKIRLRRQLYDYIIGLGRPQQLEVRVDGVRVKQFTIGGEAKGRPAPVSFAGNIAGDPEWEVYMHNADANLEARFPAPAGSRVVSVDFIDFPTEPEGVQQPREIGFGAGVNEWYEGNAAVDSISIGGPYRPAGQGDTVSRRRIFVCRPSASAEEEACAGKILSALARRAYRRPITSADQQTLVRFYKSGRSQGDFEAGVRLGIERILSDPDFLFRIERQPPKSEAGTAYRLNDLDLASRLSFFLWSSIPDDQLLDLAERGKLKDADVLEQQTRRMLADPRSRALVENFFMEWLNLRKLREAAPDPDLFPDFDASLRQAFQTETELFLKSQLQEDRSAMDLWNADYTFLNERLAQHYQIPGVYGSQFRRVLLKGDERRGLLGQGSILLVTSYPNRTSPVLRGKWLLDILGMPPPPPPPDVPALKESGDNGKPASMRERLEKHRENPACATCHVRMDPLGFALENFDAIGKWRTLSDGLPIDASASLPDGATFQGVSGLRSLLLSHRKQFVNALAGKLMSYAVGREMEYYDFPAVRKVEHNAAAQDYRWSAIISSIIESAPFQMSTVAPNPPAETRRAGNVHK